ncbi:MAG TPA: hypothetical protein PKA88_22075 [Polyangiaceae bacterium]|nr:hypothetical protein [Polyangiaceae bacterium]
MTTLDADAPETPFVPALFRHRKRKDWGRAILAWDRNVKRAYQFEDGELRIVAEGFFGLMEEIDVPADDARSVVRTLVGHLDASEARCIMRQQSGRATMSLDDQMGLFNAMYPGGFQDPQWLAKTRGEGAKRHLKRHRNRVIAEAKESLAKENMDRLLVEHKASEIIAAAESVMARTDLVSAAQLKPFSSIDPKHHTDLASGLRDLLYGSHGDAERVTAWVQLLTKTMGVAPAWQLATVLLGLVRSDEHLPIRPTSFRDQARYMAPRVTCSNSPDGATYARLLSMSHAVRDRLLEAGLKPADFVDVHDFIRVTLGSAAKAKWEEAKKSVESDDVAAA